MASTQNANAFANTMIGHVNAFITTLGDLQRDQDRLSEDPGLAGAAAAAMNASGRPDLTAQHFTDAATVVVALTATFAGGNPSNKSAFYNLL
jgi:phage host-nuclease inhibitor protein Gam